MSQGDSLRKMLVGFAFFCLTCITAVVGYVAAGWSLIDSLYMVVITIFGVGYGEVQPIESPGMKVFTAMIIIAGCSSGIYVVGGFVQMIAEGELQRALGVRRMSRGIDQTSQHVIICGFGRVGRMLAKDLVELGEPFVCVDANPGRIDEAEGQGYLVVTGNAGEEETLMRAGIDRARVLATVLPDDAENVFITLTARELSEDIEIIARGESEATRRKLIRSGANHVVLPASIGASKIASMISCPDPDSLLSEPKQRERLHADLQTLGLSLREFTVDATSDVLGSSLGSIRDAADASVLFVAIRRTDGTVVNNPTKEEIIREGDRLYVLIEKSSALTLKKKLHAERPEMVYRGLRSK